MSISEHLIKDCIAKKEVAIYQLYKSTYSIMKDISLRYQMDAFYAEEAINFGFHKVILNLSKYDSNKSFKSWFKSVIINANIDLYRKNKRHYGKVSYSESPIFEDISDLVSTSSESKLKYKELLALIDQLSNMTKQVFNLFAIDGYTHKEISSILDISEGTSKWHVSNARKKLKVLIKNFTKREKVII